MIPHNYWLFRNIPIGYFVIFLLHVWAYETHFQGEFCFKEIDLR